MIKFIVFFVILLPIYCPQEKKLYFNIVIKFEKVNKIGKNINVNSVIFNHDIATL